MQLAMQLLALVLQFVFAWCVPAGTVLLDKISSLHLLCWMQPASVAWA
jgi:hypothetical protein